MTRPWNQHKCCPQTGRSQGARKELLICKTTRNLPKLICLKYKDVEREPVKKYTWWTLPGNTANFHPSQLSWQEKQNCPDGCLPSEKHTSWWYPYQQTGLTHRWHFVTHSYVVCRACNYCTSWIMVMHTCTDHEIINHDQNVSKPSATYPWNNVGKVNFNTERTNWKHKDRKKTLCHV